MLPVRIDMFAKISRTAKAAGDNTAGETAGLSPQPAAAMPPFWELEALIAQGHDAERALKIMARRHVAGAVPVILSSDSTVASPGNASGTTDPIRLSA